MDRVEVTDLLGVPYKRGGTDPATGLDCYTAAQLVTGRLPALSGVSRGLSEIAALQALTEGPSSWGLLGREACVAREVGDLILTDSPQAPAGLAILVDAPSLLFLTATPERGVHLRPARAFTSGVVGVYRWQGAA